MLGDVLERYQKAAEIGVLVESRRRPATWRFQAVAVLDLEQRAGLDRALQMQVQLRLRQATGTKALGVGLANRPMALGVLDFRLQIWANFSWERLAEVRGLHAV